MFTKLLNLYHISFYQRKRKRNIPHYMVIHWLFVEYVIISLQNINRITNSNLAYFKRMGIMKNVSASSKLKHSVIIIGFKRKLSYLFPPLMSIGKGTHKRCTNSASHLKPRVYLQLFNFELNKNPVN